MLSLRSNQPDVIWFDVLKLGNITPSLTKSFRESLHKEEQPYNTHNISENHSSKYCDLMSDILVFEDD